MLMVQVFHTQTCKFCAWYFLSMSQGGSSSNINAKWSTKLKGKKKKDDCGPLIEKQPPHLSNFTAETDGTTRKWTRCALPVVLAESRDEISLLMFRVEEENGPVQGALLIQANLSTRRLLRAQHSRHTFIFLLTIWTTPCFHRFEELDASILIIHQNNTSNITWMSSTVQRLL